MKKQIMMMSSKLLLVGIAAAGHPAAQMGNLFPWRPAVVHSGGFINLPKPAGRCNNPSVSRVSLGSTVRWDIYRDPSSQHTPKMPELPYLSPLDSKKQLYLKVPLDPISSSCHEE